MAGRKTDTQILDEILAERAMGGAGDPLSEAKRFLGRGSVVDDVTESQDTRDVMSRVEPTAVEQFGPTVGETADLMTIPLSFAAGPVGWAAGAGQIASGAKSFMDDPSLLGAAGLGIGAIPALRAFSRMGGAAKEAPVILRGADEFADVTARNPASAVTEGVEGVSPSVRDASGLVDQYMPNVSGKVTQGVPEQNALESLVRMGPDQYHSMTPTPPVRPSGLAERGRFNTQTPEVVSDATTAQASPALDEVDELISGMGNAPMAARAEKAARRRQQMQETLAALRARQSHGTAGFSQLPQMSDAEAARIGASIDRIVGR